METEEITQFILKAFEYKEQKDYKKAVDYFYKALTMDSNSSEIMCELSFLYEKLKKPDRAVEYLEQALNKKPDDERIKFKLAEMLKNTGNYKKAQLLYKELFSLYQTETEYFAQYVYVLLLQEQFDLIISEYERYKGDKEKNSKLNYYMGVTYENINLVDEAEKFYKAALNADNSNFDAGYKYASLLFDKKQYDESEKILLSLINKKDDAYIFYLLGEINFINNKIDDSIKYLSSACRIDSKNPSYFYELATAYSLKGFLKEAEYNYLEAIKLDPNNLSYNYSLAYLYYMNKEASKSLRVLDYILAINPQQPNAMTLKSQILLDNNDIVSADKLIKQSLELNNRNDYAYLVSSKIYAALGWWEKAADTVKKAIEINSGSVEYKLDYAKYLLRSAELEEAIKISNIVLKDNPKLIDALLVKVEALMRQQKFDEADKVLVKIFKLDSNSSKAHFYKSQIYKSDKKYLEAAEELKFSIETEPDNVIFYENIAECYFKAEVYDAAYQFYKEASNLDITQAKYKYMMAKIAVLQNDTVSAISNFILAKRLEPANFSIILDYYNFLCSIGKNKEAVSMLKDSKRFLLNENEIKTIDSLIKKKH